jgi:two-component system response regulator EvgA
VNTIRVLIVDDDPLVRSGLRLLFRSMPELFVVGDVADGAGVLPYLEHTAADVVLCDVRMRTVHGPSIVEALRLRHPGIRIVLMSTVMGSDFADHALNIGADEFIVKTAHPEEIRAALGGSSVRSKSEREAPLSKPLSHREAVVAGLVAAGATNAEISLELHLTINTVKTYVSRIMSKLDVSNRVQLANLLNRTESGHSADAAAT